MDTAVRASIEERAHALSVYVARGLAAAHRETGVAKSTLRDWAREEGFDPAELAGRSADQTANATAARRARTEELREELRELLMVRAIEMLEWIDEPHTEYLGRDAVACEYPRAPARSCQAYATSAAILIDKFRLESGEVVVGGDVTLEQRVARVLTIRDEVAQMRDRRSSVA